MPSHMPASYDISVIIKRKCGNIVSWGLDTRCHGYNAVSTHMQSAHSVIDKDKKHGEASYTLIMSLCRLTLIGQLHLCKCHWACTWLWRWYPTSIGGGACVRGRCFLGRMHLYGSKNEKRCHFYIFFLPASMVAIVGRLWFRLRIHTHTHTDREKKRERQMKLTGVIKFFTNCNWSSPHHLINTSASNPAVAHAAVIDPLF